MHCTGYVEGDPDGCARCGERRDLHEADDPRPHPARRPSRKRCTCRYLEHDPADCPYPAGCTGCCCDKPQHDTARVWCEVCREWTVHPDQHDRHEVLVARTKIYPRPARRGPAWYWSYTCIGPDGTRFDNTSITELRRVLKRHYGREIVIVEPWKDGS